MIPLCVPHLDGNEWQYVKNCLDTGWISSAGAYVQQFESMVADFTGARHAVACMNGTAGLHLSLHTMGVGTGMHVLVPNLTFVASLNAIQYTGASPILIDIDQQAWQMDLGLLERFLAEETDAGDPYPIYRKTGLPIRAIMPVHVLGNMGDMNRLVDIANKFHLDIVEDTTEALGSSFEGKHAGTFGKMGVFSFNGNKLISTGGGGMIITDDPELAAKAKHLSTQAKISPTEYIHDEVGFNYRLVNVLAAIGVAQMEQLPHFLEKKQTIAQMYRERLVAIPSIRFQEVDPRVKSNEWLFTIRVQRATELIKHLDTQGIQARSFWRPMNQLPMFAGLPYIHEGNVSQAVYETAVSIPCSVGLTPLDQEKVIQEILHFYESEGLS